MKNFTASTDLWGLAFFNFTSRNAITSEGNYDLPVTVTDINASGLQADEPVYHYYVKGCTFTDFDFAVGTHELNADSPAIVGSCYPNPTAGTTNVDVTVAKTVNVTVDIFNITGAGVLSTNYGILTSGKHVLTIDGSRLRAGIYLLSINIGEKKFTQKMVVK